MRIHRITHNERGLSLLELVLSVTLLTIISSSFLLIFRHAQSTIRSRGAMLTASYLAAERIEDMTRESTLDDYGNITTANYPASETMTGDYTGLTRTTTITEVSHTDPTTTQANSGLKRIDVKVTWGSESHEQVTLHSFVAEYN